MPRPRPSSAARRAAKTTPPSRGARSQILVLVLSSLVICSLVVTAVVTISIGNFFGSGNDTPTVVGNYQDPNQDVLAQQQTVVAKNPNDVESTLLLANMLANSGKLQEAIPYYQKALDLKPDDASARLDFARALSDSDLNGDAELQFKKTIAIDPNNQDAHYYLAELYSRWQPARTSEAIAEYRKAFEIDPRTLVGQRARDALAALGVATPAPSPGAMSSGQTMAATPQGTPQENHP